MYLREFGLQGQNTGLKPGALLLSAPPPSLPRSRYQNPKRLPRKIPKEGINSDSRPKMEHRYADLIINKLM